MSHVDWTPWDPGEARDVDRWNTAMQALVTGSSAVASDNLAQEGLTLDRFDHRPRALEIELDENIRDATGLTSTSWADFAQSGTSFNYGTNITLLSDEALLIWWRVFLSTRVGSPGRSTFALGVDFRIGVKDTVLAEVFSGTRPIADNDAESTHGWVGGNYVYATAGEINYVRLQYQLRATGTIRPGFAQLYAMRIRRVS